MITKPILEAKIKEKSYKLYKVLNDKNHPPYWLKNEEEEGMSLTEEQLFEMFNDYFIKKF